MSSHEQFVPDVSASDVPSAEVPASELLAGETPGADAPSPQPGEPDTSGADAPGTDTSAPEATAASTRIVAASRATPSGADAVPGSELAGMLVRTLTERSLTIATCESLTGGGICAALTDVPGSSAVVLGGLITYASDLKVRLAGVDAQWVAEHGVINETTAVSMATGVRAATGAMIGLSCTGVAGPAPQDGHEPGDVWIAVAIDGEPDTIIVTRHLALSGDRSEVRAACRDAAFGLLLDQMR